MARPEKRVAIGIKGRHPRTNAPPEFEHIDLDRAIFSTGWDGDIVVLAHSDGRKRVIIE